MKKILLSVLLFLIIGSSFGMKRERSDDRLSEQDRGHEIKQKKLSDLDNFVLALRAIDPNVDSGQRSLSCSLSNAILQNNLSHIIALLQRGACLNVAEFVRRSPLVLAVILHDSAITPEENLYSRAQLDLLAAVSARLLDPHTLYSVDQYNAMGISSESAQLIQSATQSVNSVNQSLSFLQSFCNF